MSEKSFEDKHDRLMREAFRKLEEDRGILTGSAFRKWHNSPSGVYLATLVCLAVFYMITGIRDGETTAFSSGLFLVLMSAFIFSKSQADIVNKRIDKIVQVTGAEKKLEEKCQAAISQIAGLESKKGDV